VRGPQGAQGAPAEKANTGAQGAAGPIGATGPQGFQGAGGNNSSPGPQGAQGAADGGSGWSGAQGAQGSQGATGPSSVTCYTCYFQIDSNCYAACNFGASRTLYQQSGCGFGPRYLFYSNCLNSYCDYGGYYGAYMKLYNSGFDECYYIGGSCGIPYYNSQCYTYSDIRLKTKIETITDALEKIMQLEAVEYDWNKNLDNSSYEYFKRNNKLHAIGLIAQNVRLHFPEVISITGEGYYSIDYNKLNSVLVEGIKEQQVFIEDINKQINELENQLA
jgi:hypothetical protein